MKKISIILFNILFVILSHSQEENFVIKWVGAKTFKTSSSEIKLPNFQKENYNYSNNKGLTFTAFSSKLNNYSINQLYISNVVTQTISETELKDLKFDLIPNQIEYFINESLARNKKLITIEISPIFFENGTLKKLISFSLSVNNLSKNESKKINNQILNSALSTGQWYRFKIDTTGVYKLDKSFFNSLGINVQNLNPKKIKVYGHGGKSLPLKNSETVSYDLIQNAVKFIGEDDGIFNNEDYLLFYAIGPKYYNPDNDSHINPYSNDAYYYIKLSNENGLRMSPADEPSNSANTSFTSFHDYAFVEKDEYNIGKMGRRWFGHRFFFENARTFNFNMPNLITSSPLKLKVLVAATAESSTSMEIKVNNNIVDNLTLASVEDGILATESVFNNNVESATDNISVDLYYNNNGNPSASAYLDYIAIEAERELIYLGNQFQFKHNDIALQSGVGEFVISNASTLEEIWDISNPYNPKFYLNNEGNNEFIFKFNMGNDKKYQVITTQDIYTPTLVSNRTVSNQNLKGTIFLNEQGQFEDIDYLIITPAVLKTQSDRLANINREVNNLNVKVVTLESIYAEFSSGMQDVSGIRNFVKYVYENSSNENEKLKYLCLFGDASFDYKNRTPQNTNISPSWMSIDSFSLTSSFISDDFFGMMDSNEGTMISADKLDIAVGRILADSPNQANQMIDKIESYYNEEAYGNWRNNFLLISDDVDKLSDRSLQETTDLIAENVKDSKPFINVEKIHTDTYSQQTSSGGSRYPQVNEAIFDALEVGAVVVNYFGHGGEDGLALERIFDKINAQELNNPNKLSCFVTVTCEYTKFDNPLRKTAGEYLYWNYNGGAISLITTTRQIFINVGVAFNTTLSQYLFDYENSQTISMAEALRLTKNDPAVTNIEQRRLVFFIGDPALKLPLAAPDIITTKLNNQDISNNNLILNALSPAKIEGFVSNTEGMALNDYNGILVATVYDKNIQRSTLGNDGVTLDGQLITMDYESLGEVIFRGQVSVENGEFEINFIVPRDIEIAEGNGKISYYSKTENPLSDKRGYSYEIKIGGVNLNAPEDNTGPDIKLFMNDESFISGGITNESPILIAKLFDESGINTSSGVGHDIVAIIDGDETNPYVLNDYYVADLDSYQSGSLSYPLRNLSPGLHTLSLKAWDVYNNSSTKEIQFIVYDQNESLKLTNVLNYPNPFLNYTEFWFNHNSSGILDVSIQIFTISGKLIKTIIGQTNSSGVSSLSRNITWDGTNDYGSKIGKGVYIYKLKVKSQLTGLNSEKIEKLVIL